MSIADQQPARNTVGRYRLLKRLAAGGMGEVWLAATRGPAGFEKHFAIKRILPHLAADEEFVGRFIDEARIVVTLVHGNVAQVLDMGEEDGDYYIAMEYVPGKDLRRVLRRCADDGAPMGTALALYVTAEVCRGLGYAHRKVDDKGRELRIVHRDVSPSNVLLSWEGEVKVTDFGVASAMGRLTDSLAGRLHGKIAYMSPEQAGGEVLDRRSDVYSAGIVCWEMLTGRRLFDGPSDTAVLRKVQDGLVEPPSTLAPQLPAAVDEVVLRALARSRGERYSCMEDFSEAVQRVMYAELQGPSAAPALADRLRELFPDEVQRQSAPSLDDALRDALGDLDGAATSGPHTLSAAKPEAGSTTGASAAGPSPQTRPRPVLRWFAALSVAGLAVGYLAGLPSGVASGRLEVTSAPSDAEVVIGGFSMGRTPWTGAALPAGEPVRLELRKDGYAGWQRGLELAPRAVETVHARLAERPAATPALPQPSESRQEADDRPWRRELERRGVTPAVEPPSRGIPSSQDKRRRPGKAQRPPRTAEKGVLYLRAKPTGRIRIGDRWYPSPVTGLELPAGKHTLTVEHPEWGVSQRVKVVIRPGEDARVVVEIRRPPAGEGAP